MIDGVKLIECRLTPQEWEVIKIIRAEEMEFGRIAFTTYIESGKITRVEMERIIESKKLR